MKNQNDLIFSISAIVFMLIFVTVFWFTKRVPVPPAAPTQVNVTAPKLPTADVQYANSLPNGSGNGNGNGAAGVAGFPAAGRPAGGGAAANSVGGMTVSGAGMGKTAG